MDPNNLPRNAEELKAALVAEAEASVAGVKDSIAKVRAHLEGLDVSLADAEAHLEAVRATDVEFVTPTEHVTVHAQ